MVCLLGSYYDFVHDTIPSFLHAWQSFTGSCMPGLWQQQPLLQVITSDTRSSDNSLGFALSSSFFQHFRAVKHHSSAETAGLDLFPKSRSRMWRWLHHWALYQGSGLRPAGSILLLLGIRAAAAGVCADRLMAARVHTTCRLVYGLKSNVKDNLHYLEDGSHVYPAGHTVVIISADGKTHRFIPGSPECEGISAIMLSPNKKLLAVAERAEKAVVSVYDMQTLKRRKQLVAADVGSKVSCRPGHPPAQEASPRSAASTSQCMVHSMHSTLSVLHVSCRSTSA